MWYESIEYFKNIKSQKSQSFYQYPDSRAVQQVVTITPCRLVDTVVNRDELSFLATAVRHGVISKLALREELRVTHHQKRYWCVPQNIDT